MRARSRRAHPRVNWVVTYGDEGDEDGDQEQPQQDRGMNEDTCCQRLVVFF